MCATLSLLFDAISRIYSICVLNHPPQTRPKNFDGKVSLKNSLHAQCTILDFWPVYYAWGLVCACVCRFLVTITKICSTLVCVQFVNLRFRSPLSSFTFFLLFSPSVYHRYVRITRVVRDIVHIGRRNRTQHLGSKDQINHVMASLARQKEFVEHTSYELQTRPRAGTPHGNW